MAAAISTSRAINGKNGSGKSSPAVKWVLVGTTVLFLTLFLLLPLVGIFTEALRKGVAVYIASLTDPIALKAIKLTLLVSLIVVPLNAIFGVAIAWAVSKFNFVGRSFLISMIDLLAIEVQRAGQGLVERVRAHESAVDLERLA